MGDSPNHANRAHWLRLAGKVARQVNFGWWIEMLSAPLLVVALVFGGAVLFYRREVPDVSLVYLMLVAVGLLLVLGGICWWLAAKKFETRNKALVRIEAEMELKNALSAAQAGIAPWPAPRKDVRSGLRWQWPRLLIPPMGALLIIAASLWIPVASASSRTSGPPEQPQAWKKLSSQLDALTKEEVVDEKYLEETRKRLNELKAQEEELWFSHSSLEATDSLKKSHTAEAQRMERELGRAEKALEQLEKMAGAATEAEKNKMMEEYDQALQGLQNGAMKPNPKLLEQLKALDPQEMAKLSSEQLKQLKEKLKKNQEAMKQGGAGEGEDWSDELLADQGEDGVGEDGVGNDKGGVQRGPGHAPRVLGKEKDAMELGQLTGLESKDLSASSLGDLLELQNGEHGLDRSASAISAGGETDATGKGGDRVWRDSLDPAEQKTLKRFFE